MSKSYSKESVTNNNKAAVGRVDSEYPRITKNYVKIFYINVYEHENPPNCIAGPSLLEREYEAVS